MQSKHHPHRTKQPRAKQQRAEKLRAWKARAKAANASQARTQNATPAPAPAPPAPPQAPPNPHAPAVSLLYKIAILGRRMVENAIQIFHRKQADRAAGKPGPNPCAALLRMIRALIHAEALDNRLRSNAPLPERTPPKPLQSSARKQPQAGAGKSARKYRRRALIDLIAEAQSRAAADIERLLKARGLPEVLAKICRDLRIDPSRLTWRKTPKTEITPYPTLPPDYMRNQSRPADTAPPIRPDPSTDPPR